MEDLAVWSVSCDVIELEMVTWYHLLEDSRCREVDVISSHTHHIFFMPHRIIWIWDDNIFAAKEERVHLLETWWKFSMILLQPREPSPSRVSWHSPLLHLQDKGKAVSVCLEQHIDHWHTRAHLSSRPTPDHAMLSSSPLRTKHTSSRQWRPALWESKGSSSHLDQQASHLVRSGRR